MVQWVRRSLIQAPRNGTTSHAVAFTAATAGNLLVAIAEGAVTSTTPAGWTLPTGGSAINNTGLYVWHKTATAGESSLTTTHNGSNYPAGFVVYEFPAGSTFVKSIAGTGLTSAAAGPNLTGLTGTNLTFGAIGIGDGSGNVYVSTAWSGAGTPIKDTDTGTAESGTDGYGLSIGYVESNTAASFQPTGSITQTGAANTKEALTFAVNVATVSAFSGAVALTGAGALSSTGTPALAGPLQRSGSGTLGATGTANIAGTLNTTANGTLELVGAPSHADALILAGNGTLTLGGNPASASTIDLAGSGTLKAAGTADVAGTMSLTSTGTLTLTGTAAGPAKHITVTAALGPRRWQATIPTRDKQATLNPRRWAGTL